MKVPKHRPIAMVLIVFVLLLGVSRPVEATGFGNVHPLTWFGGVVHSVEGFFGHLFAPNHATPAPARSPQIIQHDPATLPQATLPIPRNDVVQAPPPHTSDPVPPDTLIFNPFADLMLMSKYGDIYPADGLAPALGTITHPYSQLNLTHATIDSGGTLTLSGGLTVGGISNGFLHADTNGTISTVQVDLGKDITSTLGVGNGGTGQTSLTANGILYGNGTGALQVTAAGTNGQLLLGVTSGAPAFATLSGDASITNAGVLTLKNTGPGAGSLGTTAAQTPVVTVDAQGRVTAVSNTAIAIDAAAITGGTLGVSRGGTGQTSLTANGVLYGNGTSAAGATAAGTDGQMLLGVTAGNPAFATLSGDATITNAGVLTLKNTGTASTYGSASQVPVVTTDAQGRVTGVTNTSIALAASQITSGSLGIVRGGTNNTAYTTGSLVYYDGSKLAEDNTNLFWNSTNHRLGLGTTAPLAALDVAGSASLSGGLSYRGGGTAHTTSILDGGTYNIQRSPGGSSLVSSLFIDASGNVGIGTTNPQGKLHIKDGGYRQGLVLERAGTSALRGYEYIGDGTNSTSADEIYLDTINSTFHLRTGALGTTESLYAGGGNVGIRTTFMQDGGYAYLGSYNSGGVFPRVGTDLATAWNFSNGDREITFWNTDTCAGCGDAFAFRHLTGSGSTQTTLMHIFPTGNVTIGGTLTQGSDQRLKTNIEMLSNKNALAVINELNPVTFQWRAADQSNLTQFGFIAQEVEQVLPQLVSTNPGSSTITLPDGSFETITGVKSVNYVGLIPPLVKAVQELDSTLTIQGQQVSNVAANLTAVADTQRTQTASDAVSEQSVASLQVSVQSLADRVTALEKQAPVQPSPFSASLSATLTGVSLSLDNDATISGSLTVQGRATLNDLGVTGNITAGVLSIHGLDGTIDAIGNTLKLQSLGTGSIDLLAGKVTVDGSGNVVAKGEITAKKINIDESDPSTASIGNGTLATGSTSVSISTKAAHAKSRIFVTPRGKTGDHQLEVGSVTDGASFTVQIEHVYTDDISFDWWIVN